MSVLAHVVDRGALQAEPAATQALAYILNSNPEIARAFVGMLQDAHIDFEPGRIEAEREQGKARPDLTIRDSHGDTRVFVENKFWAGLTAAQPVTYLEELPKALPSALLFIVPEQKMASVWNELKTRCGEAGLHWADAPGGSVLTWARVDCDTMLIASWRYVLDKLLNTARVGGHDDLGRDILQLQALTDRMDTEAFLPLRDDEVTDQKAARRLINYIGLIDEVVFKLVDDGIADINGFKSVANFDYFCRYFRMHGKFELSLTITFKIWRDHGISPLWLFPQSSTVNALETIRGNFSDVKIPNKQPGIPIRLKTGVERERVIGDAAAQIKRIAEALQDKAPDS